MRTTFGHVESRQFRLIHGACQSLIEFLWLFRRELIASIGIEKFLLSATLSDTGVSVAEFGISANAR